VSEDLARKRLAMLEAMIAKGSTDPFHHYAHAMALRTLGQTAESLEAFEKVAGSFPKYVPTYLMAGQVCVELQRDDDARGWFERGIEVATEAKDEHARSELQAALDEL